MESHTEKNKLLADRIAAVLEGGITVSGTEVQFISATFAGTGIENLKEILSDPESFETETLIHLLLYPDHSFQMTIEPVLEKIEYTSTDTVEVIDILRQMALRADLRIQSAPPGGIETLTLDVPAAALETLVERLKITRRIDSRISDTLSQWLPDRSAVLHARVQLRNARFSFNKPVGDFFCRFIRKTHDVPDFFSRAFPFMVNFFDEMNPGTEIYASLMEKKRLCRQMIGQATAMEKILREMPVEAVMMRGEPILWIDAVDALDCIDLIDGICILLFGMTEIVGDAAPAFMSTITRHS